MDQTILPSVILSVIAVLSPLLTAFFTKASMSSRAKNYISIAVSVVIAVAYALVEHTVTNWSSVGNIVAALPVVYGIQQAAYNLLLKDLAAKVQANVGVGAAEVKAAAAAAQVAADAAAAQAKTVEPSTPLVVPTVG